MAKHIRYAILLEIKLFLGFATLQIGVYYFVIVMVISNRNDMFETKGEWSELGYNNSLLVIGVFKKCCF